MIRKQNVLAIGLFVLAFLLTVLDVVLFMRWIDSTQDSANGDVHFPVGSGASWYAEKSSICTHFITDGYIDRYPFVPAREGQYKFVLCGSEGVGVNVAGAGLTNGSAISFAIGESINARKQVCLSNTGSISIFADGYLYRVRKDTTVKKEQVGTYNGGDFFMSFYSYGAIIDVEKPDTLPEPAGGLGENLLYNTYSHRVDSDCSYVPGTGDTLDSLNRRDLGYKIIEYAE